MQGMPILMGWADERETDDPSHRIQVILVLQKRLEAKNAMRREGERHVHVWGVSSCHLLGSRGSTTVRPTLDFLERSNAMVMEEKGRPAPSLDGKGGEGKDLAVPRLQSACQESGGGGVVVLWWCSDVSLRVCLRDSPYLPVSTY